MSLRRLAAGFASLSAATAFAQVLGFVVMVVLARRLTTDDIGAYSFAIALVGYFAIPANFGVTGLALRDLAQRPGDVREIMAEVIALQLAICLAPYALMLASATLLVPDPDARAILPVVGLTFVVEGLTFAWVLTGTARFTLLSFARVVGALVFGFGCLLFVHGGPNAVEALGWVTLAGVLATGAICGVSVLAREGRPRGRLALGQLLRRFKLGVPLGISVVMISIYYTADSLMLGYFKDSSTVGQYAIAYKIPLAVITIAGLWGSVLFPHASALAQGRRNELREQLIFFGSCALVVSLPLIAGAALVADDLIPRLFGAPYAAASTPFILLTAAAALIFFTLSYGTVAIAIGDERHYAIGVTLGAIANVVINLVSIPALGMEGAALATLAAEIVVFAYIYRRLLGLLGPLPLDYQRVGRAATATLVMVAVLLPLGSLTVLVRVVIGVTVFTAAAAALRVVAPAELRAALRPEAT